MIFESFIASERARNSVSEKGVDHEWFRDNFVFTKIIDSDDVINRSEIKCSAPRYFYVAGKNALKIPNVNNNAILRHYWFSWTSGYGTILFWGGCECLFFITIYSEITRLGILGATISVLVKSLLLLAFLCDVSMLSKIIPVPYIVFDNEIKSIILRGEGVSEVVPYHHADFNVIQIGDSTAYCALELNIKNDGEPTRRIITDICESHPQAFSILKTYLLILKCDENIYQLNLKRHPALLREFNMHWLKGIAHFFNTSWDWISCVLTHYIAFRWAHGHPMGVLKRYIIEQDIKRKTSLPHQP